MFHPTLEDVRSGAFKSAPIETGNGDRTCDRYELFRINSFYFVADATPVAAFSISDATACGCET